MNITPNHTKQEEMSQILANINEDITHIKEKHTKSLSHGVQTEGEIIFGHSTETGVVLMNED